MGSPFLTHTHSPSRAGSGSKWPPAGMQPSLCQKQRACLSAGQAWAGPGKSIACQPNDNGLPPEDLPSRTVDRDVLAGRRQHNGLFSSSETSSNGLIKSTSAGRQAANPQCKRHGGSAGWSKATKHCRIVLLMIHSSRGQPYSRTPSHSMLSFFLLPVSPLSGDTFGWVLGR